MTFAKNEVKDRHCGVFQHAERRCYCEKNNASIQTAVFQAISPQQSTPSPCQRLNSCSDSTLSSQVQSQMKKEPLHSVAHVANTVERKHRLYSLESLQRTTLLCRCVLFGRKAVQKRASNQQKLKSISSRGAVLKTTELHSYHCQNRIAPAVDVLRYWWTCFVIALRKRDRFVAGKLVASFCAVLVSNCFLQHSFDLIRKSSVRNHHSP